jgi:hypothetical protein
MGPKKKPMGAVFGLMGALKWPTGEPNPKIPLAPAKKSYPHLKYIILNFEVN